MEEKTILVTADSMSMLAPDELYTELTLKEAEKQTGLSEGAIRGYFKKFDVPYHHVNGKIMIGSAMVPVLIQINSLLSELNKKANRREMSQADVHPSIKRTIADALQAEYNRLGKEPPEVDEDPTSASEKALEMVNQQTQMFVNALTAEYGELREQIGRSEAINQMQAARISELEQQVKLLPAQTETAMQARSDERWAQEQTRRAEIERDQAREQLAEQNHQNQNLTEQLQQAQAELQRREADALIKQSQLEKVQLERDQAQARSRELDADKQELRKELSEQREQINRHQLANVDHEREKAKADQRISELEQLLKTLQTELAEASKKKGWWR